MSENILPGDRVRFRSELTYDGGPHRNRKIFGVCESREERPDGVYFNVAFSAAIAIVPGYCLEKAA